MDCITFFVCNDSIFFPFQEDTRTLVEDTECFEYSDEIEEDEGTCGQQKETGDDYTELRALLLFFLLWQSVFKVADRAIIILLKFFKIFLTCIGKMLQAEALISFAKIIPETLYMIEKKLGLQKDSFIKYAVCPKCKTLYNFDKCIRKKPNGETVSAKCSHVEFPRHPGKLEDDHVEQCL